MENKEISMTELLCKIHEGLKRQGPGSDEATNKALDLIGGLDNIKHAADLGCGTGWQTMLLSKRIKGKITGLDFFADFINVFNKNAKELNLDNRVNGIVGSMDALPFKAGELDLIWSEGAIDNIGFKKGLTYWRDFLKKDGYVAVTCPSWFTDSRPLEIEKWWLKAVPDMAAVGENIVTLQKAGYAFVAAFTLPETCWTDNYFIPRALAEEELLKKYPGSENIKEYIKSDLEETGLYKKYNKFYGYAFYIGKKI